MTTFITEIPYAEVSEEASADKVRCWRFAAGPHHLHYMVPPRAFLSGQHRVRTQPTCGGHFNHRNRRISGMY